MIYYINQYRKTINPIHKHYNTIPQSGIPHPSQWKRENHSPNIILSNTSTKRRTPIKNH